MKTPALSRRSLVLGVPLGVPLLAGACSSSGNKPIAFSGGDTKNPGATGPAEEEVVLVAGQTGPITPLLTPKADLVMADGAERHISYAPDVPPQIVRAQQRIFETRLEVIEGVCPLDPANDVTFEMWGYRIEGDEEVTCGTPGPVLRGRVGDVARIVMTNAAGNNHPHNIDFHAITGQGGGAADLTAAPGETVAIEIRLLYPGAFMYHCAFGDVPEHISRGMYGMFIVDPERPLPDVDHEWAVMQSEWYVTPPDADGVVEFDRQALSDENPAYVTFNGRTGALTGDNSLHMSVGERARIYMVNEGLNLNSNWHPIGSHWDTVYPEAATHPANNPIRGSQSTLVFTGGATVTELVGVVPSTIILVDHALSRAFYKGAIGMVVVDGDVDPEIFEVVAAGGATAEPAAEEATAANVVTITDGAWDPGNAELAYSPRAITVATGTTITWNNNDAVLHTVTAGVSNGSVGDPSGEFDSGDLLAGESCSHTFNEVGEFPYFCTPHPWMTGTVVVEAA